MPPASFPGELSDFPNQRSNFFFHIFLISRFLDFESEKSNHSGSFRRVTEIAHITVTVGHSLKLSIVYGVP